jgi:hypothetical protein
MAFFKASLTVLVVSSAQCLFAGTVFLSPIIGGTYDPANGQLQQPFFVADGTPHIYRVDLVAQLFSSAPDEIFCEVLYDISLNGLLRNTLNVGGINTGLTNPKPNYVPDRPTTDLFIKGTGQPLSDFYVGGFNGDFGASPTDLQGIITAPDVNTLNGLVDGSNNPVTDPRLSIATGAGTRLGAVYVKWDGLTTASLSLNGYFVTMDSVTTQRSSEQSFSRTMIVSEPTSLTLVAPIFILGHCWRMMKAAGAS